MQLNFLKRIIFKKEQLFLLTFKKICGDYKNAQQMEFILKNKDLDKSNETEEKNISKDNESLNFVSRKDSQFRIIKK